MITKLENPEYLKFKKWVEETYPNEWDKIDFFSYFDSTLTLSENKGELLKSYPVENPLEDYKEAKIKSDIENANAATIEKENNPLLELMKNPQIYLIAANRRQGKTCLGFRLCELYKRAGKKVYVLSHPNQKKITELGFLNLYDIDAIEYLNNCVIYIDEPQVHMSRYEKRGSIKLQKLLTLAFNKGITLIFSTCDTRYFTIENESYTTVLLIKKISYETIKKGSILKTALEKLSIISPEGFSDGLKISQYALYYPENKELNGVYSFTPSKFWSEELSKPYQNSR